MKPTLDFMPHIPLSLSQRKVLAKLLRSEGRVVEHKTLLTAGGISKGGLDTCIFAIRRKLSDERFDIVNHRGVGYSLSRSKGDQANQED